MCVTQLCVTTQPCQHRWYQLVRPCDADTNLSTCSKKLGISGWEVKSDTCPYCQGNATHSQYRLIGDGPAPPVGSLSGLAHSHSSHATSLHAARRDTRLELITSRTDSVTSIGSKSSIVTAASEKNRAMNSRLDAYFFPSTDSPISPYPSVVREDDADSNTAGGASDTSSNDLDDSVRHASMSSSEPYKVSVLSRMRMRSKRISHMFK
jgi:hypothetical protein